MNKDKKGEKILDFEDDGDLILSDLRESVALTPENAKFFRSAGGLASLELHTEKYGDETFERVVIYRAFPVSAPDEFISVRTPDTKEDRGKEIGMIRHLSDFDEAQCAVIEAELNIHYFTPVITKINSRKEKFGNDYWDVETTAGHFELIITNPFGNVRRAVDGRIFVYDMDGNAFYIPDVQKLDSNSFKIIDAYL